MCLASEEPSFNKTSVTLEKKSVISHIKCHMLEKLLRKKSGQQEGEKDMSQWGTTINKGAVLWVSYYWGSISLISLQLFTTSDTVWGMSRLLGNAMSALVLVWAATIVQQQHPAVVCEFCRQLVSCGRVTSKDVLYSDDTMYF